MSIIDIEVEGSEHSSSSGGEPLCLDQPPFRIVPVDCPCCTQLRLPCSNELPFWIPSWPPPYHLQQDSSSSGRSSMSSSGAQSRTPRRPPPEPGGDHQSVPAAPESSSSGTTSTGTPPYARWAIHMRHLLEDSEGVRLFKLFLEQEAGGSSPLDFWFACQGFKNNVRPDESQKIYQLIKVIYRTYIRGEKAVSVCQETRKRVSEKLSQKNSLDQTIFDEAQKEVEEQMRSSSYLAFLKSDLYVQYVASCGTDSGAAGGGGGSCRDSTGSELSERPASELLPTVEEDRELDTAATAVIMSPLLAASTNSSRRGSAPSVNNVGASGVGVGASVSAPTSPATSTPPVTMPPLGSAAALTKKNLKMTRRERAGSPGRRYMNKPSGMYLAAAADHHHHVLHSHRGSAVSGSSHRRPPNPYHVSYAPVSAQDSELQSLSSDALTDDTMSLTDSSLDGTGHGAHSRNKQWRQQRRAMRRSAQQNREDTGFGAAGFIPRTEHPKQVNLAETSPTEFARLLSEKLDVVLADRANIHKIDNLLIETEEHVGSGDVVSNSVSSTSSRGVLRAPWAGRLLAAAQAAQSQDAQAILEDHMGRIWEKSADGTPAEGRARSPDGLTRSRGRKVVAAAGGGSSVFSHDSGVTTDCSYTTEHRYVHHYHYHRHFPRDGVSAGVQSAAPAAPTAGGPNTPQLAAGTTSNTKGQRKGGGPPSDVSSNMDSGVSMVYDQLKSPSNDKVLAWMSASTSDSDTRKRSTVNRSAAVSLHGYVAAAAMSESGAPRQPSSADTGMEPLGTPCPTVQLEEAKRRLQQLAAASREPSVSNTSTLSSNKGKKSPDTSQQGMTVGYYLCGDPVPYRITWHGKEITLGQFKTLVAKKGNYKYFFKKACDEFESGVVHEEISVDEETLPLWEGKVVGKIERID